MHAPGDHVAEQIDDIGAHARSSGGEGVRAEHEDRPHHVLGQWRSDADRVTPHEVALQLAELLVRDAHGRKIPEARVDAVDRVARLRDLRDDARGLLDLALGGPIEADGDVAPRDRYDVADGQVVAGEPECGYFRFSRYQAPSSA